MTRRSLPYRISSASTGNQELDDVARMTDANFEKLLQLVKAAGSGSSPFLSILDVDPDAGKGNDDTVAIQTALDTALCVFFPDPEVAWTISEQLTYRDGAHLIGASALRSVLTAASPFGEALLAPVDVDCRLTIRSLGFDNTDDSAAGGVGLSVADAARVLLDDVRFANLETGLYAAGAAGVVMLDPEFDTVTNELDDPDGVVLILTADGRVSLPDGEAAAPALRFVTEPTLGMFRAAAGIMGLFGGLRFAHASNILELRDGADGAPSLAFVSELAIGLFRYAAGVTGISGALHVSGNLGLYGAAPVAQQAAPAVPSAGTGIDNAQDRKSVV